MPAKAERLSSLTGLGLRWDEKDSTLECTTPHALTRAAGYMKHVRGQRGERVFFRGQTMNWPSCTPSLFRARGRSSEPSKRRALLDAYIAEVREAKAFIRGTSYPYDFAHEAVLQHYGIATCWLDLVDNIWVALWFAVQACVADRDCTHHWHFTPSQEPFAYILLVSPGEHLTPVDEKPGLYETERCALIDLRVAVPSLYVRPHAQHGLLIRRKAYTAKDTSLDGQIVGTIKVATELARRWLGSGYLHDPHVVFPPPHYDAGYARLLKYAPAPPKGIGGVGVVFA